MATNYERGRAFEYRARDELYKQGAVIVVRSAGSKTKVDLIALFPALDGIMTWPAAMEVWIVQCKRDGKLPAAERDALLDISVQTGALAYHAHTGPNGRGVEFTAITMEA